MIIRDGTVTLTSVEFFASIYSVKSWLRKGVVYHGRAQIANEGEGKPEPGRTPVSLRLLANGRLEISLQAGGPGSYFKCPEGVQVR